MSTARRPPRLYNDNTCLASFSASSGCHRLFSRPVAPSAVAAAVYVPERVYDTRRQAFADLESMLADLAKADVVFVGEQHDDPNTHRLEVGDTRRAPPARRAGHAVARDVRARRPAWRQQLSRRRHHGGGLPQVVSGPGRATRPTIARWWRWRRAQGWPVVAANVPRRFASSVAKTGLTALDTLTPTERSWVAAELKCPQGRLFRSVCGDHERARRTRCAPRRRQRSSARRPSATTSRSA